MSEGREGRVELILQLAPNSFLFLQTDCFDVSASDVTITKSSCNSESTLLPGNRRNRSAKTDFFFPPLPSLLSDQDGTCFV